MTRTEHLISILAEECAEVAQRCSKALRFGLTEVQPGQPTVRSPEISTTAWRRWAKNAEVIRAAE